MNSVRPLNVFSKTDSEILMDIKYGILKAPSESLVNALKAVVGAGLGYNMPPD